MIHVALRHYLAVRTYGKSVHAYRRNPCCEVLSFSDVIDVERDEWCDGVLGYFCTQRLVPFPS